MDECVSVLSVRTTNESVYYTLNINFLEDKIVFINIKNKIKMTITYKEMASISKDRIRVEYLLS